LANSLNILIISSSEVSLAIPEIQKILLPAHAPSCNFHSGRFQLIINCFSKSLVLFSYYLASTAFS